MFILRELSHGFLLMLGPSKKEEEQQGGGMAEGGEGGAGEETTEPDGTDMETTTMPPEMYDSYSYYNRYDYYYYYPPRGYRSLRDSEPFIARVLNSLDVVESTFSMLDIDEPVCRKRAICEVQRTASTYPLLGDYLKYLSQSLRGLDRYREAQDAGSVLEDCALLFADCPYSVLPREGIKKE
ncbi:uncharacterized protein LOC135220103 isoform X2 [Macrobrachium nipponense]|uniref:uncharacterized protein LOC135220103 isoform X2 n=1 Tax=Macrobrachium nipponense TaxID=159736 RepID=UPI0030C8321B